MFLVKFCENLKFPGGGVAHFRGIIKNVSMPVVTSDFHETLEKDLLIDIFKITNAMFDSCYCRN